MTSLQTNFKEEIINDIEKNKKRYIATRHDIHGNPEIGNEEFYASRLLINLLEDEGFTVEKEVAGHKTAFVARKKSVKLGPTIAFLAEYDALPELGHACGHKIIGTMSVAAAIAFSKVIDETGGEELEAAMMIHPNSQTSLTKPSLAIDPLDFEYSGKSAHAAASPDKGINALDAVIQLFNGINAIREHVSDDVRIHGIITHGGDAPNIVPDYAKARFYIRAATRTRLNNVTKRIKAIAEGAALATGAELNVIAIQNEVDNLLLNDAYNEVTKEVIE